MAKISVVCRGQKREKTVKQYAKKRLEIKQQLLDAYKNGGEGVWEIQSKLQDQPRNACGVRIKKRCNLCGRPHGVYRKFGLCRLCLRKYAMQGLVPGVEKASW